MRRPVLTAVAAAAALAIAGPPVTSGAKDAPSVTKAAKKRCEPDHRGRS